MSVVFRTDDLPPADRLSCWHEMTGQIWVPVETRIDREADFRMEIRATAVGALNVLAVDGTPLEQVRTPRHIRQADPEQYVLMLGRHGFMRVVQDQREATIGRADLTLFDTSRPFRGWVGADGNPAWLAVMIFPHALLPLPPDMVGRLLAVRLSGHDRLGRLVVRVVADLARQASDHQPAVATRLAAGTLDLLAALLADQLEAHAVLPPETRRRALLHQIHAFIQQRLDDHALVPDMIAAAHHISTRYLHKLFQEQGVTVGGWIRDRRLDRCRRDLTDPALASLSIGEIAARWGLGGSAYFSRVFRAAHGVSPREYRRLR